MTSNTLLAHVFPVTKPVGDSLPAWATTVGQTLARTTTAQRVAAGALASVALGGAMWLLAGPDMAGYLGVFVLSLVANCMIFLPSGRGAILIGGALVLDPMTVAIVAGIGGAIWESTGYFLGRGSHRVISSEKTPAWLSRFTGRHMGLTVLVGNAIPNPLVDVISIVAGRLRYSLSKFLAYAMAVKVLQSILVVYVALWNISLISAWIGLD